MNTNNSDSRDIRHFERRARAAKAGLHLPTEIELLRGMPFLNDDIASDVREFGERLSRRLKHKPRFEIAPLVASLDDLAVDQSEEAIRGVGAVMEAASGFNATSAKNARLRVQFYLAMHGDHEAAAIIAGQTASIAFRDVRDCRNVDLVPRALAWAVVANDFRHTYKDGLNWPRGVVARDLISCLEEFSAAIRRSESPGDTPKQDEKSKTSSSSTVRRTVDPGSGSDIIAPTQPSETSKRPVPTIETLAGYGEASAWALQLRDELQLWREGSLRWDEMSTKILLFGAPGVGKTLFARALCNSLQIPLLATSVARWLEPSHLGDVLRRIRRAFAEAEAHSPCIVFVDEFDGIGRRVDMATREYTDYWNSVVNCCLEMLDGAARTSGVIVVCATNDPGAIDPALLRSGRLERQVEIPLPDTDARLAILQHHLSDDVDAISGSAPQTTIGKAELHNVLRERLEMISDAPYRDLVAAAIRTEANAP